MKTVCWKGKEKVKVERVPDPTLLNANDAIVRTTATCICGSDLHLYNGFIPTMQPGDILGHEFVGDSLELAGSQKARPEECAAGLTAAGTRPMLFAAKATPQPGNEGGRHEIPGFCASAVRSPLSVCVPCSRNLRLVLG